MGRPVDPSKPIAADLGVTHSTVYAAVKGVRTRGDCAKLSERQRQHVCFWRLRRPGRAAMSLSSMPTRKARHGTQSTTMTRLRNDASGPALP